MSNILVDLVQALNEARPFVYRARMKAKIHEQDQIDAELWFEKYTELVAVVSTICKKVDPKQ